MPDQRGSSWENGGATLRDHQPPATTTLNWQTPRPACAAANPQLGKKAKSLPAHSHVSLSCQCLQQPGQRAREIKHSASPELRTSSGLAVAGVAAGTHTRTGSPAQDSTESPWSRETRGAWLPFQIPLGSPPLRGRDRDHYSIARRASEERHKRLACRRATESGGVSPGRDFLRLSVAVERIVPGGSSESPQPSLCSR